MQTDSRTRREQFLKKNQITEELMKKTKRLSDIANQRGQSLAQMALAWNLTEGKATSVLIGASRVSQLQDNLKTLNNLKFSQEELKLIDEILLEN